MSAVNPVCGCSERSSCSCGSTLQTLSLATPSEINPGPARSQHSPLWRSLAASHLLCAVMLFSVLGVGMSATYPPSPEPSLTGLQCDFEEEGECAWEWQTDMPGDIPFKRVTGRELMQLASNVTPGDMTGLAVDAVGSQDGHFLYLGVFLSSTNTNNTRQIKSPWLEESGERCRLEADYNVWKKHDVSNVIKVLLENGNFTSITTVVDTVNLNKTSPEWKRLSSYIGKINKPFRLGIEVMLGSHKPTHVAIDNIRLVECFESTGPCQGVRCTTGQCVLRDHICDITRDCPNGEDEAVCEFEPEGSRCDFESGWCGWRNIEDDQLDFKRHRGPTEKDRTGPSHDHTFKNLSGWYILSELPQIGNLGDHGVIESPFFNPPPCYHGNRESPYFQSCKLRLYFHKLGRNQGSMIIKAWEDVPNMKGKVHHIDQFTGDQGKDWQRLTHTLPTDIRYRYKILVSNVRGSRFRGDMGFDDFSLSPECFGRAPTGPPGSSDPSTTYEPHDGVVMVTTCGATGHEGPTPEECRNEYRHRVPPVPEALTSNSLPGTQIWKVPYDGYYTLSKFYHLKFKLSKFNIQSSTFKVQHSKFNTQSSTKFNIQSSTFTVQHSKFNIQSSTFKDQHSKFNTQSSTLKVQHSKFNTQSSTLKVQHSKFNIQSSTFTVQHSKFNIQRSAFKVQNVEMEEEKPKALVVAGGGAGLAWIYTEITNKQDGRGVNESLPESHGHAFHNSTSNGAGTCLGWALALRLLLSLPQGGCRCDHVCVHLDEHLQRWQCICDDQWVLDTDGNTCIPDSGVTFPQTVYLIIIVMGILLIILISTTSICCYNRYQRKKFDLMRRGMFSGGPEIQLSGLRASSGGMVTEYNPNYEFGGGTCTIKDLREIPRENLTLVKALGQGAFGEVYQGYLKNYAGDSVEMPVAVKTLPEMSSNQAEMDFLMEALIMSKFAHPNIVHFIGVCFNKLPRFIVLELLSGGDLKSFLREARPKPDRPSALTMRDLLTCAMDVAKGCEYLEEKHFIHRDIAARNCLLTTKGPGRVVKIADFGMARDIYRNDYYRKGGKAMLPVKWMPPEAFLDGIFTSKTDIWSFGVLLWEVMSLGYMPYPGRGNQEVMQLVTNGGRLEPPTNCPGPVYRIMTQCWHPIPDERPSFTTILERLGYCVQDPDVVSHVLPVFQRPPSAERDATVMRPLDNDACLTVSRRCDEPQSPASTDYLIPLPSSYSLSTVRSELNSTPSIDSGTDCCQMERLLEAAPPPPPPPTWETSFTNDPRPTVALPRTKSVPPPTAMVSRTPSHTPSRMAESQSTQPLLKSSPPDSPRSQEVRERLMRPGERAEPNPIQPGSTRRSHHYHPHRYNNSGSSNNSSSSSNNSSVSNSSNTAHSNSSASTLPLDPATLPCIPPPLQYVNVQVRGSEYDHEPYIIHETREHREISC
nr:ALK tyrosine kinase receptor-like [Cherax quadricarinatus]